MKKIIVGTVAKRDKDGNFLPSKPIYREIPDDVKEADLLPLGDLARFFYEEYKKTDKTHQAHRERVADEEKNG